MVDQNDRDPQDKDRFNGSEEIRLNQVGAEVVGWELHEYAVWPNGGLLREYSRIDENGVKNIIKHCDWDWSPSTKLDHTVMVMDECFRGGYTIKKVVWSGTGFDYQVTGYAKRGAYYSSGRTLPLVCMRCVKKAWKAEGGEK